jgi:hypothetical protein
MIIRGISKHKDTMSNDTKLNIHITIAQSIIRINRLTLITATLAE